ncbi:MAG: tRNA epoxyqueuosine(34) reductase QueG [Blastocatellia bacterium]|nr:tRNA epoxyqueuosine(34) reductase QueG [Blastocatellia bacterium]
MNNLVAQIKEAARSLGFEVAGITSVEPLARDDAAFRHWRESGFAAGMEYMTRRTELHAHPKSLVPWAASLITLAINYYATAPDFDHENRYGRVARYAWGLDYHDAVKPRLHALAAQIEKMAGRKIHARSFVDAVPLLERAAAARAGIGFFGKNTNLLQPQRGSWFFLAEILVDLELPADDREIKISCGSCRRCLDACPTDAFAGPYELDSRRCISYLTIENKGAIPHELREGIGEWIFGCDVCQDVCPFNRFSSDTAWPELRPEAGVGHRLDLVEVLSIATDEEFRARFKGTPLTRPKRRGLLRNAAVVAANVGCVEAVPVLIERINHDPEPLIRSHSLWAVARLDAEKAAPLINRLLRDADPQVREECLLIVGRETN